MNIFNLNINLSQIVANCHISWAKATKECPVGEREKEILAPEAWQVEEAKGQHSGEIRKAKLLLKKLQLNKSSMTFSIASFTSMVHNGFASHENISNAGVVWHELHVFQILQ